MTAVLTITQGLPGAGKTTWAKAQPDAVRVNRDELRAMMLLSWPHGDRGWERLCTLVQFAQIRALLEAGVHVICDDTNLEDDVVAELTCLAEQAGACARIQDFTHVSMEECIARDAKRARPVGSDVIRRMWVRYRGAAIATAAAEE